MQTAGSRPGGGAELQLESRLRWLMLGRLSLGVAGLLLTWLLRPRDVPFVAAYTVLVAAIVLNLVYLLLARAGVSRRPFAAVQLALDVLIVGVLVYLTGIDRFFAFFFFANVIAAGLILGFRTAMAMASLSSILLAAVSTGYYLSGLPEMGVNLPLVDPLLAQEHVTRLSFLLPFLVFFALSLHVVAWLSGKLTAEVSSVRIFTDEILQNMAGGVLAVDHFGEIQFINAQAARLLGLREPLTVRGKQVDDLVPRPVAEYLRRAGGETDRVAGEVRLNGSVVSIAVSRLVEGRGGRLRGLVAILNDQSLRAQMEEMTRRAERFKALLEMSAGMAHEIRNPLASIRGAAQELGTVTFSKEDDRQLLDVVIRESDRLDQIISEFLEYASDRPMEMLLVDIAQIVRETVLLLEARRDRQVEIHKDIPRTLLCRGEPDKLKQVFLNLGLNALDACQENVRIGHVRFRCVSARVREGDPRQGVRVEVSDDGRGVSRDNLQRVFDPFFTTKPQGTGMGLAIARKIVLAHGGEITMESREGAGTTVRVWLPSS